jgi:hypothetical protein
MMMMKFGFALALALFCLIGFSATIAMGNPLAKKSPDNDAGDATRAQSDLSQSLQLTWAYAWQWHVVAVYAMFAMADCFVDMKDVKRLLPIVGLWACVSSFYLFIQLASAASNVNTVCKDDGANSGGECRADGLLNTACAFSFFSSLCAFICVGLWNYDRPATA